MFLVRRKVWRCTDATNIPASVQHGPNRVFTWQRTICLGLAVMFPASSWTSTLNLTGSPFIAVTGLSFLGTWREWGLPEKHNLNFSSAARRFVWDDYAHIERTFYVCIGHCTSNSSSLIVAITKLMQSHQGQERFQYSVYSLSSCQAGSLSACMTVK